MVPNYDWRDKVEKLTDGARALGAIESNQHRISFRMNRCSMRWGKDGGLAMVKLIQGKANGTLRDAYLEYRNVSNRKKQMIKQTVRMSHYLHNLPDDL